MDNAEHEQHEMSKTVLHLQTQMVEMEERLRQQGMAIGAATSAAPVPPGNRGICDRQPDGTLLRLSAAQLVAKTEVIVALNKLLVESGKQPEDEHGPLYKCLTAPATSKSFTFQFRGTPTLGAAAVQHLWASLRTSDGSWKERFIDTPTSGPVRLYTSLDESPKQSAERRHGKAMAQHLAHSIGRSTEYSKRSLEIIVDWLPVVRIEVPAKNQPRVQMSEDNLKKTNITEEQIKSASHHASHEGGMPTSNTRWTQCL